MATEPNPKMDAVLRSYARKRRAQAREPFEMTPVIRNRLQSEVARAFREPALRGAAGASTWRTLWPGLAWAIPIATLATAAGLWLLIDHNRDVELASNQSSRLDLFTANSPAPVLPAGDTGGLSSRLESFELKAPESQAPERAYREVQEALARRKTAPAGPEAETVAQAGRSELRLALAPSPNDRIPEFVSNSPKYQFAVPPGSSSAEQQKALGDAMPSDQAATSALKPTGGPEASSVALRIGAEVAQSIAARPAQPLATGYQKDRRLSAQDGLTQQAGIQATGQPQPSVLPMLARNKGTPDVQQQMSGLGRQNAAAGLARPQNLEAKIGLQGSAAPAQTLAAHFQQVAPVTRYRQNLNSPPVPRVLTNFEFFVAAPAVRIIDADGSVYEGTAQLAQSSGQTSAGSAEPITFTAAGTNQSLNQLVTFTGQFEPGAAPGINRRGGVAGGGFANQSFYARELNQMTDQSRALVEKSAQAKDKPGQAPAEANVLRLGPGTIQGTFSVGANSDLKIEAQQVGP